MLLHEAQKIIAKDPHKFRVICAGRRFGKTMLSIDQMKGCASQPNKRVCYIAPTFQQARDIVWEALRKDCEQAAQSINEARLEIKLFNGSIIKLQGWESIEAIRGQKYDLVILDEVAMFRNFWMSWQEAIRPTLIDNRGEAIFISTPKGFNHFYDLFNMQETDSDFKSFKYTTYDNPHIPVDEIDKSRNQLGPDRFAQEFMADFTKTEGLVFKEFQRQVHLMSPEKLKDIHFRETLVGVDFGFTNPCAVLTVKRDSSDTYYVTSEWYERGRTDIEVAEYVASISANRVYPDPEAPAAIVELRKKGVNVRTVTKGKDSIKNGIDKVRELFLANKLKISTDCKNLIMELEMYSYPDARGGVTSAEKPLDEYNHALDALRYVIMMTSGGNQGAHVHYSSSSMPTKFVSKDDGEKRVAHTHIPYL